MVPPILILARDSSKFQENYDDDDVVDIYPGKALDTSSTFVYILEREKACRV